MSVEKPRNELLAAIEEGVEALKAGRDLRSRTLTVPDPPKFSAKRIGHIRRRKFKVSQTVFAHYLGVSPSTVRAWEQSQREPSLSARRLIQVADERPEILKALATAS